MHTKCIHKVLKSIRSCAEKEDVEPRMWQRNFLMVPSCLSWCHNTQIQVLKQYKPVLIQGILAHLCAIFVWRSVSPLQVWIDHHGNTSLLLQETYREQ